MIYLIIILFFAFLFTAALSYYLHCELLDERHQFYDYSEWMDPVNLVDGDKNDEVN